MTLAPGARLGPYEVVALIGSGGMGEVYRARDTRLKRDVAIKILPDAFANDAERLARFQREAELLATLNHPNIAQIHGIEDRALVLELVDGPTLADRIAQGPIPLDEALPIARQITEALEAAHEQGIIHRDLKPANIKLTADGRVKVLDFGLAKALEPSAQGQTFASVSALSQSPTITSPAVTLGGVILGTAAYMSPEQTRGKPVDKRTDIWAFGCVFFEMLTAKRAFGGDDVTDVLAAIIKDEPDCTLVPIEVRRLLIACLRKDRNRRLRDIADVWELQESPAPVKARNRYGVVAAALTTVVAAVLAAISVFTMRNSTAALQQVSFEIAPPPESAISSFSVSPDGSHIGFVTRESSGNMRLWVRSLDSVDTRALNAPSPITGLFWSSDSRFIVVASRGELTKIETSGASAQLLAQRGPNALLGTQAFRGGAWHSAGNIIFSRGGSIWQVPQSGGTPIAVTLIPDDVAREYHSYPSFLPDGYRFLYFWESPDATRAGIYIGDIRLPPKDQDSTRRLAINAPPVFVAGAGSHIGTLLFARNGSLMSQSFDTQKLTLIGESVLVANDVTAAGSPAYSLSANGLLAFRRGPAFTQDARLLFHDRAGKVVGQIGPTADYRNVMVSPDGRFMSVDVAVSGQTAYIWAGSVARAILSRLVPGDAPQMASAVSSAGQVAFSYSANQALGDIYVASVNGASPPELWVESDEQKHPNHFSYDGRFLIYDSHHPTRRQDLWIIFTTGNRKPIPFLVTAADETFAQFSPDGRWVAYSSDESGRRDVYVQGFAPDRPPAAAVGKWQISNAGGDKPRWSANGNELFYLAPDGKLMTVPVKLRPQFEPGLPVELFQTQAVSFAPYDVMPDGRFLINTRGGGTTETPSPIAVTVNWRTSDSK